MDAIKNTALYRNAERHAALLTPIFEREIREKSSRYSLAALLMRAAGRDARLQKGILQFVSVLPMLSGGEDIYEHYRQFVLPHAGALPPLLSFGARLVAQKPFRSIGMKATVWLIEKKVAPRFIIADEKAYSRAKARYAALGAETNVDFLGEDVLSWAEADRYLDFYIKAMRRYGGKEAPFNASVKFSALYPFFKPENYAESKRVVAGRYAELLRVAEETNSCLAVDAERYAEQSIVEAAFFDVLMRPEFRRVTNAKIALQTYLKNALGKAERFVRFAAERRAPFHIRLVKGAYLETERALAEQKGWDSPVWGSKKETDESFQETCAFLMAHWGRIFVAPATHNPQSVLFAQSVAGQMGLRKDPRFTFEVLHGLGEPMCRALCEKEWRVLVYLPLLKEEGKLLDAMGYFARRLEENTAGDNALHILAM